MKIRYFDNAATTRVKDEVLNEMLPYFSEQYGNPSSLYSIGRSAKKKVEEARKKVANLNIFKLGGTAELFRPCILKNMYWTFFYCKNKYSI